MKGAWEQPGARTHPTSLWHRSLAPQGLPLAEGCRAPRRLCRSQNVRESTEEVLRNGPRPQGALWVGAETSDPHGARTAHPARRAPNPILALGLCKDSELWGQPCLHKAVLGFESMSFIPGNPALRQGRGLQEFAALGMRAARCGMLDLGCRAGSEVLAGSPGSGAEQTSAGAAGVWEDLSTRGFRCHLPLPARGVTALPPLRLQNKSSDKVSLLPPSPHPRSPTWA